MKHHPPKLPLRFFRWFCRPGLVRYIEGDLLELFHENVNTKGIRRARWLFAWDVVKLLRPEMVRSFGGAYRMNSYGLFFHFLKVLFRGLARERVHALINITGLAVGLAAAMVLFQYIQFELSYDRFHPDADRIYRLTQSTYRNGNLQVKNPDTWSGLGKVAKETLPGIEDLVRIHHISNLSDVVVSNPQTQHNFFESDILYVDPGFFRIFRFPFLNGDPEHALEDANSVVITGKVAKKYFGRMDVVGQTLKVYGGSVSGEFTVRGVLEDLPENTHLKFDILMPMEFLLTHYGQYVRSDGWAWTNFSIYIKTVPTAERDVIVQGFNRLINNRLGNHLKQNGEEIRADLQPLTDIHLRSDLTSEYGWQNGNIQNVWIFAAMGLMILLVAWINYVNLSTARAIRREKEVGIKKSMGASRGQLISQFLFESFALHCIALIMAIVILFAVHSLIIELIDKHIPFEVTDNPFFLLGVILFLVAGSFFSGVYPATILAHFRPASIQQSAGMTPARGHSLRRGLVFFQFLISILLIGGTCLIYQQVTFMKSRELGVDMEKILIVPGPRAVIDKGGQKLLTQNHQIFKNRLLDRSGIQGICGTSNIPTKGQVWTGAMRKFGAPRDHNREGEAILVGKDFPRVYDLDFIAGSTFTHDMQDYEAVVINEKAVEVFEFGSPMAAINQSIILDELDTMRIQGVVKDFHWNSLRSPVPPMVFGVVHDYNAYLSIRINTDHITETLEYIEANFREIYPEDPFECFFLDQDFNAQYQSDVRFGSMFFVFSLIAIFIACIGLFALISFSATLKVKEIGIRKVLGASMSSLLLLLSREYFVILGLSGLLAMPLIWVGARLWLENFAFHISVDPGIFIIPVFVLAILSVLTVGYKTFRTANANPVDSLRNE